MPQSAAARNDLAVFAFLALVWTGAFLAYRLGLPGDFMFDDYPNLKELSAHGGVKDLPRLKLYLDEAFAGPTGRPVSMLTFLIDARQWPADPERLKYKNILLHLLNGLLLFVVFKLGLEQARLGLSRERILWTGALGAAFWLLHPLHVSTVLYVIQRMAELSAFFVLLGLAGYLWGRRRLEVAPRKAYAWMTGSLVLATALATLSKENGALLPLLVLVLEGTLLSRSGIRPDWRWRAVLLWTPSVAVFGYLVWTALQGSAATAALRGFTPWERLLTETRILMDYLAQLVLPRPFTLGMFRDDIAPSHSLLEPVTTLASTVAILVLVPGAWLTRRRWPLLSTAILFFFAAHLLESTVVPLELYFEHRNYLPSLFLFLPLAALLVRWHGRHPQGARWTAGAATLALAGLLAVRADAWSDRTQLYLDWAHRNPGSARAQLGAAEILQQQVNPAAAVELLRAAAERHPSNLAVQLQLIRLSLRSGAPIDATMKARALSAARQTLPNADALVAAEQLSRDVTGGMDHALDTAWMAALWEALDRNPHVRAAGVFRAKIQHELGALYAYGGDLPRALQHMDQALEQQPRVETAMMQAAVLATHEHYCAALARLDRARALIDTDPDGRARRDYYQREIQRLKAVIGEDARAAGRHCAASNEMGGG